MNISVISREIIKPHSHVLSHLSPFKLCLLDQFFPTFYNPFIFFYPKISNGAKTTKTAGLVSAQLKRSLSQTLSSSLYPFSGRVHDNTCINNFEEGVPFVETRVKCRLSDFLQHHLPHQFELQNRLLPCQPNWLNSNPESAPLVTIQTNVFDCGGIALGICFSHKIFDGTTVNGFLESWSANNREQQQSCNEKNFNIDDLSRASLHFPPVAPSLAQLGLTSWEKLFSKEGKYITKRFVFDVKAIATLKLKAKGKGLDNPSRTEALFSFIWKSCMAASPSTSSGPSLSAYPVNIRHRTKPHLPKYSIGNHWLMQVAVCDTSNIAGVELSDLAASIRETFTSVNSDYLSGFQGSEGFEFAMKELGRLQGLCLNNPQLLTFSSWLSFDFKDIDFGWGKPVWVGVSGEVGPAFTNFVRLKEIGSHQIEAWMTLEEPIMSSIEQDPEFLAFATPNPGILIP